MASNVFGQVEKLLTAGLIEKKEEKVAKKLLKGKSNLDYLEVLYQLEMKKVLGKDYNYGDNVMGSFDFGTPGEKTIADLSAYLVKLRNAGIINDKQFNREKAGVDNKQYSHVLLLLYYVRGHILYDNYWEPSKVLPFVETLKNANIVTTRYDSLVDNVNKIKVRYPIDFLNYCDHGIVIDTRVYPEDPDLYLKDIYLKTASVLPDLEVSDFNFEVVPDTLRRANGMELQNFLVSFKSHGKIHEQESLYKGKIEKLNRWMTTKIQEATYFKVFNDVLADLQSPYRLHYVFARDERISPDSPIFGILALTEEQLKVFNDESLISVY